MKLFRKKPELWGETVIPESSQSVPPQLPKNFSCLSFKDIFFNDFFLFLEVIQVIEIILKTENVKEENKNVPK